MTNRASLFSSEQKEESYVIEILIWYMLSNRILPDSLDGLPRVAIVVPLLNKIKIDIDQSLGGLTQLFPISL